MNGAGEAVRLSASQLIAFLNSLQLGDLDSLRARLVEAEGACEGLSRPELAERLAEARGALDSGDLKTFRRRVETVVSKLGHLR